MLAAPRGVARPAFFLVVLKKRIRRLAVAAAVLAAATLVWLLFLPVPVGWACRLAASRLLPRDAGISVAIDAATLRWLWGESALRLEVAGVTVQAGAEIIGRIGPIRIEVDKAGLRQRHGLPAAVAIERAQLRLDFRPGGVGARWLGTMLVEAAAPARAPFRPLELPEAALPREGRPVVLRLGTLGIETINARGDTDWSCGPLTARVQRRGRDLGAEVTLQLAREGAAPPVTIAASVPLGGTVLAARVRAPQFSTAHLPTWPGAPFLPVQVELGLECEGEFDLARGSVRSLAGRLAIARGRVALDELGAPIEVEDLEVRGRAAGEPLAFALETCRLGIAGARLGVERFEGTLGPEPRLAWKLALENVHAARWLALLPPHLRPGWPQTRDADALRLARWETEGDLQAVRSPAGRWQARGLSAQGRATLNHRGEPLQLSWRAGLAADGAVNVQAEASEIVPARWASLLGDGTPLAMVALPIVVAGSAQLGPEGDFRGGAVSLRGGPGSIALPGARVPPVPVQRIEAAAEIFDGGRRWRGARARIELDQPVFTLTAGEGGWLPDGTLNAAGEVRLENISAGWLERWLPADALAPLATWGLRAEELRLTAVSGKGRVQATRDRTGRIAPVSAEAEVALEAQVQEMKLAATARAFLPAGASAADVTLQVADLWPSRLRLAWPDNWPAPAAFDFPVGATLRARIATDGRVDQLAAEVRAGRGRLRASPRWDADVPLEKFTVRVEPGSLPEQIAVSRLEFATGTGLHLTGRDIAIELAGARRIAGELEVRPFDLPAQLALLPPDLQAAARDQIKAGEFGGGQFRFSLVPATENARGWRVEKLVGQLALRGLVGASPGAGEVSAAGIELTADFPRAEVRVRDAAAPALLRGAANLITTIDTKDFSELRAGLSADLSRVRLLAPELAALPLATEPVRAEFAFGAKRELTFRLEAPAVLGRPLTVAGTLAPAEADVFAAEFSLLRYGRSDLTAHVRGGPAQRMVVAVRSTLIDADELLRAAAPFLGGAVGPEKSANLAANTAPSIRFDVVFDRIEFGDGRVLRGLRAGGEVSAGWPRSLVVEATEGTANPLRAVLGEGAEKQPVSLAIGDASALFATLTQPLRTVRLPPGDWASLAAQIALVPTLVAGGSVDLQGTIAERRKFSGQFRLGRATVVRPPRILQMLAAGRTSEQRPLLESFSVDRVEADAGTVALNGLAIVGSGLIDRLRVRSAKYRFADGAIAADGEYFGVGFIASGTRADPQVYLPDKSVLVRALGQPVEFDFERMAAEAAEKRAAEKKR